MEIYPNPNTKRSDVIDETCFSEYNLLHTVMRECNLRMKSYRNANDRGNATRARTVLDKAVKAGKLTKRRGWRFDEWVWSGSPSEVQAAADTLLDQLMDKYHAKRLEEEAQEARWKANIKALEAKRAQQLREYQQAIAVLQTLHFEAEGEEQEAIHYALQNLPVPRE
jgi:hypothetical protein